MTIDPGSGSYVLKSMPVEMPDGNFIYISLIGSNLRTGNNDSLMIDIALRNDGFHTIYAPAFVVLFEIDPDIVMIINSDLVTTYQPDRPETVAPSGFVYTDQLPDGQLSPGGISATKTWIFHDPDFVSFSFDANLETSFAPGTTEISGQFHRERDWNGIRSPDEPVYPSLAVTITGPDSLGITVFPGPDGRYRARINRAGLYEVRVNNFSMAPCMPEVVSANPLFVMITASSDSTLNDYTHADFRLDSPCFFDIPPIIPTDRTPGELSRGDWTYLDGELEGLILHLGLGFSGCQPEHPFQLYFSGGFSDTDPAEARLVLVHENNEACDMWINGWRAFDLSPLVDMYLQSDPSGDLIILNLVDFEGVEHLFDLVPGSIDYLR